MFCLGFPYKLDFHPETHHLMFRRHLYAQTGRTHGPHLGGQPNPFCPMLREVSRKSQESYNKWVTLWLSFTREGHPLFPYASTFPLHLLDPN
jgi:hypothetical protein